ncbi:MAG: hypothetical protein IT521_01345 [Burkholderiales bacterium]|nr:hypothetical protein [Burkholderiales bacterium]
MHDLKHWSTAKGISRYDPEGEVTLVEGVELVTAAIAYARTQGITRLLVDVRRLHGYTTPELADRFWMAQDFAHAAQGAVTLAIVAWAEHIHPGKFGINAARDAGLNCDVFTSEVEASDWLASDAVKLNTAAY